MARYWPQADAASKSHSCMRKSKLNLFIKYIRMAELTVSRIMLKADPVCTKP